MNNDTEIREALIDRDPQALEWVMDTYAALLWAVAQSVLHTDSAQEVEECVADIFFELWKKPEAYDPGRGSLKTYLAAATRYQAIDRCRKLQRDAAFSLREKDSRSEDWTQALEREEEAVALQQAVQQLPEPEREIVHRRFYQGQKAGEISNAMSLDVRQVQNRLYRAKQRLRRWWMKRREREEQDQ